MKVGALTANQFYMLGAVAADFGRASMASMRKWIEENHNKDISLGRQSEILEKFERAGWIESRWSAPGEGRGQRRKKLYSITGLGQAVLSVELASRNVTAAFRAKHSGGLA